MAERREPCITAEEDEVDATLRDQATEAWEVAKTKRQLVAEEENRKLVAKAAELFVGYFGMAPDGGEALEGTDQVILERDGLSFLTDVQADTGFHLRGICPFCKEECFSRGFSAPQGLGQMIDEFRPSPMHQCAQVTKKPTWGGEMGHAMDDALQEATWRKVDLADALSTLTNVEGNYRETKESVSGYTADIDVRTIDLTAELWPTIDGTDPQTGRKNKGWAELQLSGLIAGDDMILGFRAALGQAEEAEATMLLELDRAKLAVKLADLGWRYAIAEVKAQTALLNFCTGT